MNARCFAEETHNIHNCTDICHCRIKAFKMGMFVNMVVLLLGIDGGLTVTVKMQDQGLTVFPATDDVSSDPTSVTELRSVS